MFQCPHPPLLHLATTDWSLSAIFKLGRVLIAFPLKLKGKKKSRHVILLRLFHFGISLSTPTTSPSARPAAFQELRPHFPAGNVGSIKYLQSKKCGLLKCFFLFGDIWRRRSGCWSRFSACVRASAEGLQRKDSGTQTDKITHRHLQRVSLLPPPTTPSAESSRLLLAPPSVCWVTEGSTSSQQSGLKFNESFDAYFIVRRPPSITPYIPLAARLSSPLPPPRQRLASGNRCMVEGHQ